VPGAVPGSRSARTLAAAPPGFLVHSVPATPAQPPELPREAPGRGLVRSWPRPGSRPRRSSIRMGPRQPAIAGPDRRGGHPRRTARPPPAGSAHAVVAAGPRPGERGGRGAGRAARKRRAACTRQGRVL